MRRVIVNTCSVYAEKSPDLWVEIVRACLEKDADLEARWIGSVSAPYAGLAADAERLGAGRIAFGGARPHAEVLRCLSEEPCLLLISSAIEVFPMSIMEASARGVPVACRRFPGWEDVLGEDHPYTFETAGEGADAVLRAHAEYDVAREAALSLFASRYRKDDGWYAQADAFARSAGIAAR